MLPMCRGLEKKAILWHNRRKSRTYFIVFLVETICYSKQSHELKSNVKHIIIWWLGSDPSPLVWSRSPNAAHRSSIGTKTCCTQILPPCSRYSTTN
jgi:hypothetical protein